ALFLRLWALEVLQGTHYLKTAENNQLRTVRLQAPRGPILDRNRTPLVTNAAATGIEIWPSDLPKIYADRYRELKRLSRISQVPLYQIAAAIKKRANDPPTPVTGAAAHARPEHPEGRRERAELRDPARAGGRRVGRARRRDRRARPAQRRDRGDGLVSDLQAVGVRGTRDQPRPRRPGTDEEDRGAEEFPVARPRARRHVSARLDVQAHHGARRDAG